MTRGLVLFLVLWLLGCGSVADPPLVPSAPPDRAEVGRALLFREAGADVVAALDALDPARRSLVYRAVGGWSNGNVPLTGSVAEAVVGLAAVVRHPEFGAQSLAAIVEALAPDSGQGFLVAFGATLVESVPRARDALTALSAGLVMRVEVHLGPEISSLTEFHGLRILDPAFMPTAKRGGLQNVRLEVPGPGPGQIVRKVIKVADLERYLNGTFDPQVGGFVALAVQTDDLVTPAEIIEGLRLDYSGGFAGETEVGEIHFPQTATFAVFIPFVPAMGGVVEGDYPFAGTGFTATVRPAAIPELHMPLGPRTQLPVGSQLFQVFADGDRALRGTLHADGIWVTPEGSRGSPARRPEVNRMAVYRGVPVWLSSTDGDHYYAAAYGPDVPTGLFEDMVQVGRWEHLGKIPVDQL